jgi:hypothetical protein
MRAGWAIALVSVSGAPLAHGQALPQPPELVAKPAYVILVNIILAVELLLDIVRQQIQGE